MHQSIEAGPHVVVHDPEGTFWEGALVEAGAVGALRARGVVMLPIDDRMPWLGKSAVAGYFRRSWGSGWPIGTAVPRMASPLLLYVVRGDKPSSIHWCARVVLEREALEQVRAGQKPLGLIQLAADTSQPAAMSGGFISGPGNVQHGDKLGEPDQEGGWTLHGSGLIAPPCDGFAGLGLWGHLQGCRVAWAAVSQGR